MNDEKSLVASISFDGHINQIDCIELVNNLFKKHLNKTFSELHYTITDKSKFYWKLKNRGGKFTDKMYGRFKEQVALATDKIAIDFSLSTLQNEWEYKSRDLDISFSYNQAESLSDFIISVSDGNDSSTFRELINALINFLITQNCALTYGAIFAMPNSKLPGFFIQGIKTENLTAHEETIISKWPGQDRKEKIWEVFWGNIISKGHMDTNLMNKVEAIVGVENTSKYTDDVLWFNLPEELIKFDINQYSNKRKQLLDYFDGRGLLA